MTQAYLILVLLFWVASKLILWKVRSERTALSFSVLLWTILILESLAFLVLVWDSSVVFLMNGPLFFMMAPVLFVYGSSIGVVSIFGFLLFLGYAIYRKSLHSFTIVYSALALLVFFLLLPSVIGKFSTMIHIQQHSMVDGFETSIFLLYHPTFYILGAVDLVISGEIVQRKRRRS